MTPADELVAAADKLDALVAQTTDGPWVTTREIDGYRADRWTVVKAGGKRVVTVDQTRVHWDSAAEANVAYIAAMNPLVGKDHASLLREFAVHVERRWRDFHEMWNTEQRIRMIADHAPGLHAALRIARRINGTSS